MSVSTVIVSPMYLAAVRYAQSHGYDMGNARIVTEAQRLLGYDAAKVEFIYVRGYGANLGTAVNLQRMLRTYKALGATVRYVG